MPFLPRSIVTALIAALTTLAVPCGAGVVRGDDDLGAQPVDAAAAPLLPGSTLAGKSEAGMVAPTAAVEMARPTAATGPGPAEKATSSSELAADILREAGAGAASAAAEGVEPRRSAHPAASSGAPRQNPAKAGPGATMPESEVMRELRDFGKAAAHWAKASIPWLRDEGDAATSGTNPPHVAFDWSGSPLAGGGAPAPGAPSPAGQTSWVSGTFQGTAPDPGGHPQTYSTQSGSDLVREAIDWLTTVLGHPMTWLVISLFVIGGIATSMADRRPK